MFKYIGDYGENKDTARKIRLEIILPCLEKKENITIDFKNVTGATQSFIHALLADPIRKYPEIVFDKITFKNCTDDIKIVIQIVEEYTQESL
ncbi:STAS-like domain-containing protein [Candidatus Saccharibacteria bacterium]|nr:STAS-like domain-containing protein [Candidatus Saccharibacteria bacterium]